MTSVVSQLETVETLLDLTCIALRRAADDNSSPAEYEQQLRQGWRALDLAVRLLRSHQEHEASVRQQADTMAIMLQGGRLNLEETMGLLPVLKKITAQRCAVAAAPPKAALPKD